MRRLCEEKIEQTMSILPIEVKSGRNYTIHSALDKMLRNADYGAKKAVVLSNKRDVTRKNGMVYRQFIMLSFCK